MRKCTRRGDVRVVCIGAFGVEHEQESEQQGEGGPFQLQPLLVVGQVEALVVRPMFQSLGQRGQSLLADGVVQPEPQLGAESLRFGLEFGQPSLG